MPIRVRPAVEPELVQGSMPGARCGLILVALGVVTLSCASPPKRLPPAPPPTAQSSAHGPAAPIGPVLGPPVAPVAYNPGLPASPSSHDPVPPVALPSTTPAVRVLLERGVGRLEVRGFDLIVEELREERSDERRSSPDSVAPERPQRLPAGAGRGRVLPRLGQWSAPCVSPGVGRSVRRWRIHSMTGFVTLNRAPVRGALEIEAGDPAGCSVVNELSIEKYLDALVSAEFNPRWAPAAVEAQVIAARSYALNQRAQARKRGQWFDLESGIKDQVYGGAHREHPEASRAVDRSAGWVLSARGGRGPLKAFFHSTCGGQTELPSRVWRQDEPGYRRSVKCTACRSSPRFRWETRLSGVELLAALGAGAQGSLLAVEALDLLGERPARFRLRWVDGGGAPRQAEVSANELRLRVGSVRLPSVQFGIERDDGSSAKGSQWIVRGRGYGHGVGLCQWGAKVLGERGWSARAILSHYYPDAALQKLW